MRSKHIPITINGMKYDCYIREMCGKNLLNIWRKNLIVYADNCEIDITTEQLREIIIDKLEK
jgi:hypothetical protein